MAAPRRLDRDGRQAMRALFRRRRGGLFLLLHGVHAADHEEDGEGDDQEIDDGVQEQPVVERHRSRPLGGGDRRVGTGDLPFLEHEEEVREVDVPQEEPDRRHQDVGYQRGDDRPEGRADDDAHRHVDDVPPHREFLELLQHVRSPLSGCASLKAPPPSVTRRKEPAWGLLLLRFLCLRVLDLDRRRGHPVFDGHLGADLEVPRDLRVFAAGDLPLVLPLLHDDDVVPELQDRPGHLVRVRRGGESERGNQQYGAYEQQRAFHRQSPFRMRVRCGSILTCTRFYTNCTREDSIVVA